MSSPAQAQYSAPPLGVAAAYGLLAGGDIQAANSLPVAGKVGAAQAISATVVASDGVFGNGAAPTPQALGAAQEARVWCASQNGKVLPDGLAGQALPAGTYVLNGNTTLPESQTLTLTGDTSSIYVFNITGSLTLQANCRLELGQLGNRIRDR
ncbi:ice-binding family protein [Hymenobacter antarcticus]|uniref:ice-binding family protein n=1 Tax=Hymenobacter antarcticus TaxID=486270 RepID=UPI0031F19569